MRRVIKNRNVNFEGYERLKNEYDYPDDLDLSPDSEIHKELLSHILDACTQSADVMESRHPSWKKLDEKLTVYIDLDEDEKDLQEEDESKPVSIVVPISYATRETLLTYWSAAFLKHPIFQYEPSKDPNDLIDTIMLESLINRDCIRSKVGLDLHSMWSDTMTYGFGAGSPTWVTKHGFKHVTQEKVIEDIFGIPLRKEKVVSREKVLKFEGNALKSVDPYNILPDPSVPINDVENMDFIGWVERKSLNKLLLEENEDSDVFNVKYIKFMQDYNSTFFNADDVTTGRYSKTGIDFSGMNKAEASKTTDVVRMYMWIIPSEFGLSDIDYPEHWSFRVAADRVIIEARPSGFDHNTHPLATITTDSDGHTTVPVSMLEREYPLQHAMDWLWKSHVANVRKAVNNMFVIDPSRININDVTDTRFGMIARARASAWGMNVKDAFQQVPVSDVTQNHIQDIGFLMNIDSRVFTSDQAKGFQDRRGERVSATEAKDTRQSFLSKMEKMARLGAMQGHYDIAYQFASNTLQMMDEEQVVKIIGKYKDVIMEEYGEDIDYFKILPDSFDVDYDVVPQDGSIPGGEYGENWERLLQIASGSEEMMQDLDLTRIWLHIARLYGADNPEDFKRKRIKNKTLPSEDIEKQVDQGRLVSADQLEGARNLEEV